MGEEGFALLGTCTWTLQNILTLKPGASQWRQWPDEESIFHKIHNYLRAVIANRWSAVEIH